MCGLVGVASTFLSVKEMDVAKKLLIVSQLRGLDSTGAVSLQRNFNGKNMTVRVGKLAADPIAFLTQPGTHQEVFKEERTMNFRGLMFHNRAATIGDINLNNTHPFEFDNVVGMHNGSVYHGFKHSKEYKTDSEAIFRNLNDYDVQETINNLYEKGYPAYALAWFDKRDNTINFLRNIQRPLAIAIAGNTIFWASEKEALQYILTREKVTFSAIIEPKPNVLFSYDMITPDFKEPDVKELKTPVYTAPVLQLPYQGHNSFRKRYDEDLYEHYKKAEKAAEKEHTACVIVKPEEQFPQPKVKAGPYPKTRPYRASDAKAGHPESTRRIYGGVYMPISEVKKLTDKGCAFCGNVTDVLNDFAYSGITWFRNNSYLCEDCSGSSDLMDYYRTVVAEEIINGPQKQPALVTLKKDMKQSKKDTSGTLKNSEGDVTVH
jgi:hypothetical protein